MLNELNWSWYWVIVGIVLLLYYIWIFARYRMVFFKSEFRLRPRRDSREPVNKYPGAAKVDPDSMVAAQAVVEAVQDKKRETAEVEAETVKIETAGSDTEKNNKKMSPGAILAAQQTAEGSVAESLAGEENSDEEEHANEEGVAVERTNENHSAEPVQEEPEDRRWALQQFQIELHQSLTIHKRSGAGWDVLKKRLMNVLRGFPPYLLEECKQRLERLIVIGLEGLEIEVPSDQQMTEVWNWI